MMDVYRLAEAAIKGEGMLIRVEDVERGDRLVTEYSGVRTVEEVWQITNTPVIEVHYEGGLVQYHTIGEEIEKA